MSILPPKQRFVGFRLTQSDWDVLANQARRSNVALSVIVRRAIKAYLTQLDGKGPMPERPVVPSKFLSSSDGRGGA